MNKPPTTCLLFLVVCLAGCNKQRQSTPDNVPPTLQACSLLTKEEIAEVQGSPITETKSSSDAQGAFLVIQCYFAAAETNKSVSLSITQANPDSSAPQSVDGYWEETFGRFRESDGKEATKEEERAESKEEKEGHAPRKIEGLGVEAYWSTNLVSGSLYFLKNETIVRLSLGGPDDEEQKIRKTKALAQKLMTRL